MRVGFYADIRAMAGIKEITVPAPPTLLLLMKQLNARFGKTFTAFCMESDDKISRRVNIWVNGKHMLHLQKEETPLAETDDVRIFPLIGGG